jgi:hypothetical protein
VRFQAIHFCHPDLRSSSAGRCVCRAFLGSNERIDGAAAGDSFWRIETIPPFEAALFETAEPPKYQRIVEKASQLKELGLCNEAIARHIGADAKSAAKALSWTLKGS